MTRSAPFLAISLAVIIGCASRSADTPTGSPIEGTEPVARIHSVGGITIGDPIAVTLGYQGSLYVADGSLGRILRIPQSGDDALEFQQPTQSSSFYPTDVKVSGFFIYALDAAGRLLLRFDRTGAYRDVLISFDATLEGRRTSPIGFDVDESGRIAVADAQNHVVMLFDNYLKVELVFGNYGTAPGRLNAPEGVTFTKGGHLLVCDSGNARLQLFDAGGSYLKTIPTAGTNPLRQPRRAVVDANGNYYVADPAAGRVCVFSADGALFRQIVPAGAGEFKPMAVAVTESGTIYVADSATGSLYAFR
jgi:sugar lactone lactonase YvrE